MPKRPKPKPKPKPRPAYVALMLLLLGCAPAKTVADALAPPAVVNPYVLQAVPLCARGLPSERIGQLATAMTIWNDVFPAGRLSMTPLCTPLHPRVVMDPEMSGHTGYTAPTPEGLRIRLHPTATACTVRHELGHYLGLVRHAAEHEPPGVMSDGERGDCRPTERDVAILERAYYGRVSW